MAANHVASQKSLKPKVVRSRVYVSRDGTIHQTPQAEHGAAHEYVESILHDTAEPLRARLAAKRAASVTKCARPRAMRRNRTRMYVDRDGNIHQAPQIDHGVTQCINYLESTLRDTESPPRAEQLKEYGEESRQQILDQWNAVPAANNQWQTGGPCWNETWENGMMPRADDEHRHDEENPVIMHAQQQHQQQQQQQHQQQQHYQQQQQQLQQHYQHQLQQQNQAQGHHDEQPTAMIIDASHNPASGDDNPTTHVAPAEDYEVQEECLKEATTAMETWKRAQERARKKAEDAAKQAGATRELGAKNGPVVSAELEQNETVEGDAK